MLDIFFQVVRIQLLIRRDGNNLGFIIYLKIVFPVIGCCHLLTYNKIKGLNNYYVDTQKEF